MTHLDISTDQITQIISQRVHSVRDREVLKLLLIDGLTRERAAEQVGCSVRTVYNVQKRHKNLFS